MIKYNSVQYNLYIWFLKFNIELEKIEGGNPHFSYKNSTSQPFKDHSATNFLIKYGQFK